MRNRTTTRVYQLAMMAAVVVLMSRDAGAIGIAMRFVDVTLENVEPGASFNLRVIRNLPMVVINLDPENDADILVETQVPDAKEMKEGYEPIPDPSWIKVVPNRYHLGPKASASSDVVVQIPNDPKLIGHHYEAILWAHTDATKKARMTPGMLIQAGLRSRFRMSIGTMGPAALQMEKKLKKLATINTNFSVNPDNVFVQEVEVGKTTDLKAEKKVSLKVINQADDPVELKFTSAVNDPNVIPQAGFAFTPEPKWLDISPSKIKVDGNSIKEIKLKLTIPDKKEYRGQKYMFLVQTTLANDDLPLIYNNMIYVNTAP